MARAEELWETLPAVKPLEPSKDTGTVKVGSADIWYATYGSGDPIVLLHGGLANSNYFGYLVPHLATNHKVIVIDSRGQGRSTIGDDPVHFHTMAEDVIAVMDHLKVDKTRLIGWSDGGITGFDLMINHPDRFTAFMSFGGTMAVDGSLDFGTTKMWDNYAAQTKAEYQRLNPHPEQWDKTYDILGKMWAAEPNFTDAQMKSIKVKTWIVDADHEEVIKHSEPDRLYNLVPNSDKMILPGVSHFAMQQDPELFATAVDLFLQKTK